MTSLHDFLYMGGYGFYVWSAYGIVFLFLLVQWFIPYRRWKRYVIDQILCEYKPTSGCEAGLDENKREKAQHTQEYVSIFPAHFRSKMPADRRSRTEQKYLSDHE